MEEAEGPRGSLGATGPRRLRANDERPPRILVCCALVEVALRDSEIVVCTAPLTCSAPGSSRFFSLMVDELERLFAGHDTLFNITPRTLANRRGLGSPAVP